ncbi:MAG: PEP-utilizing enzyme [Patescibacteria group bacterium]
MAYKWLELAHDKNAYLYPTALYWWCAQYAAKKVGVKNNVIGCWYKEHEYSYITTQGGLVTPGKKILNRLEKDEALLKKIEATNIKEIPIMLKAAEKLSGDLSSLCGGELYNRWQDWLNKFISLMTYSTMATVAEMEESLLSNRVEQIIKQKLGKNNEKLGEYFRVLSSSPRETVAFREELALLDLRGKQLNKDLTDRKIADHLKQYAWVGYGYNGPAWQKADIENRLNPLPKQKIKVGELIKEKKKSAGILRNNQRKIEQELKLNAKENRIINALRTLGFWKFERKFLNQKAHLMMEDFVREVAKRNHLSKIQAFMIAPNEMKDALLKENIDPDLMNERIKESVVFFKGTKYRVLSGKSVIKLSQEIKKSLYVNPNLKIIEGNTAFPGKVRGIVRRVDEAEEMKKMKKGDILVSTSTNPQIISAMQKAGAIITDSGGITCHAAIVSRELEVPCVIGTKIATKLLKDGDMIEVDAGNGIIKKV